MSEKCDRCKKEFPHDEPHQHMFGRTICKTCQENFQLRGIGESGFEKWLEEEVNGNE